MKRKRDQRGLADLIIILGIAAAVLVMPLFTRSIKERQELRKLAVCGLSDAEKTGGCGDSNCCRSWEVYQNGCCHSTAGCANHSDCTAGKLCINGVCQGGTPPVACGGETNQCPCGNENNPAYNTCRNGKVFKCGNDCCLHDSGQNCATPTPTRIPTPTSQPAPEGNCYCPHACIPDSGGCWQGTNGPYSCPAACCSTNGCPTNDCVSPDGKAGEAFCASDHRISVCSGGKWQTENCASGLICDESQKRCVEPYFACGTQTGYVYANGQCYQCQFP
ncbi:MAG: hypothetical protein ABH807_03005, partial [Candidatus Shapirobacteria bacterium]